MPGKWVSEGHRDKVCMWRPEFRLFFVSFGLFCGELKICPQGFDKNNDSNIKMNKSSNIWNVKRFIPVPQVLI